MKIKFLLLFILTVGNICAYSFMMLLAAQQIGIRETIFAMSVVQIFTLIYYEVILKVNIVQFK